MQLVHSSNFLHFLSNLFWSFLFSSIITFSLFHIKINLVDLNYPCFHDLFPYFMDLVYHIYLFVCLFVHNNREFHSMWLYSQFLCCSAECDFLVEKPCDLTYTLSSPKWIWRDAPWVKELKLYGQECRTLIPQVANKVLWQVCRLLSCFDLEDFRTKVDSQL